MQLVFHLIAVKQGPLENDGLKAVLPDFTDIWTHFSPTDVRFSHPYVMLQRM